MTSIELLRGVVKSLDGLPDLKKEVVSINKTFQFNVSDGSPFYVSAGEGQVMIEEGTKQPVSATIAASEQVLTDLFTGKLDGVQAFMQGKLKISGDIFSVQKLSSSILKARK
ncbi:MAG: SCP2 sterol-binding domain-containing protein [Thermoplasmatales archaeon]|nr:SCP2 sterol-binding domain-containing protein [Thermoplasmatales archaeon]